MPLPQLQQSLPFTVLELCSHPVIVVYIILEGCNRAYHLRYRNSIQGLTVTPEAFVSCNSTYRLWYAPQGVRQQSDDEAHTS